MDLYPHVLLDQAVMSLTACFEQMARHFGPFGFLHTIKKIAEFDQNDLIKCCMDMNIALINASGSDIDLKDLCSELKIFSNIVPDTVSSSLDALHFIYNHGFNTAVPNVDIALRIALTILITVALGERSFSKLIYVIDEDFEDETISERLLGLLEMFPDGFRENVDKGASGSYSLMKWVYNSARTFGWVVTTTGLICFMPLALELERVQMDDQEDLKQRQMMMLPQSGGSSIPLGPGPLGK